MKPGANWGFAEPTIAPMDLSSSWQRADFQQQWKIACRELKLLRRGRVPPVFASFIALMNGYVDSTSPLSFLDCACTTGYYLDVIQAALKHTVSYTGSDLSAAAIAMARMRHPAMPWHVASVVDLPFKDRSFDLVMASGVLEHVPEWRVAIGQICRVASRYVILHRLPISPSGRFSEGHIEMYGIPTTRHAFAYHEIVELLAQRDFLLINSLDTYQRFDIPEQSILFRHRAQVTGCSSTPMALRSTVGR